MLPNNFVVENWASCATGRTASVTWNAAWSGITWISLGGGQGYDAFWKTTCAYLSFVLEERPMGRYARAWKTWMWGEQGMSLCDYGYGLPFIPVRRTTYLVWQSLCTHLIKSQSFTTSQMAERGWMYRTPFPVHPVHLTCLASLAEQLILAFPLPSLGLL